tara:strand:+ start:1013 stop:1231 length:219 start_codon:yes stop_codon:yes gene_type:complete
MFNCKVYQTRNHEEIILLCKDFNSLKDIAEELGLTYSQVADFSCRRQKKNYKDFKFFPKIEINRIYKQLSKE